MLLPLASRIPRDRASFAWLTRRIDASLDEGFSRDLRRTCAACPPFPLMRWRNNARAVKFARWRASPVIAFWTEHGGDRDCSSIGAGPARTREMVSFR